MTRVTEARRTAEFLLSEAPGYRSRSTVVCAASQTLSAGEVLGKVTEGTKTATAANGVPAPAGATISAVTAALNAKVGRHSFRCIVGGAGAASRWQHNDPDGNLIGVVVAGTPYAGGGLSAITITDTGTDPAVGEEFAVTVAAAAASGHYKTHDPEALDGTQNACAISLAAVTTGVGETPDIVVIDKDAEVNDALLVWDDQDAGEKTAARAQLAALGILCRT